MVCVSVSDLLLRSTLCTAELHEAVRATVPRMVEFLKDSEWQVREKAVRGLSALGVHGLCHRP